MELTAQLPEVPESKTGTGPRLPPPSWYVWVLDLVQERFHNTSPGDLKSIFTKAGDSGSLGVRKTKGSRLREGVDRLQREPTRASFVLRAFISLVGGSLWAVEAGFQQNACQFPGVLFHMLAAQHVCMEGQVIPWPALPLPWICLTDWVCCYLFPQLPVLAPMPLTGSLSSAGLARV